MHKPESLQTGPDLTGSRVLMVDDEINNIHLLHEILSSEGYSLHFATDGPDAVSEAERLLPDLILLDVMMPGMTGYEVCETLKQNSATQDIPILFATALDDPEQEVKALYTGGVDFLKKPLNDLVVRARVRMHLTLRAYQKALEQAALHDGLTGVPNRRKFDETLLLEFKRAARQKYCLSLLMIDIDHFKQFNDHYGHGDGDQCLQEVAAALSGTLTRPADLLSRYGGEEFACVLPDTNFDGLSHIAEKLQSSIRERNIKHEASPVAEIVTASIGGICLSPLPGAKPETFLELADRNLYAAKQQGRNKAVLTSA